MVTNTTATTELVETGEQRDRVGRKLTPVARRSELVAAWRQSGVTQAEFARREGVKYPTFASWVQAERQAGCGAPTRAAAQRLCQPAPPVRFTEVCLPLAPTPPGGLEVRLPDGTLLRGGSAAALAKLVRALRG